VNSGLIYASIFKITRGLDNLPLPFRDRRHPSSVPTKQKDRHLSGGLFVRLTPGIIRDRNEVKILGNPQGFVS